MQRFLLIGNSFSEDLEMYFPYIANEFGFDVEIHSLGYGGCTIDQHLDFIKNNKDVYTYRHFDKLTKQWVKDNGNQSPQQVIKLYDWDYVFLQQASHLSAIEGSLSNIDSLVQLIKDHLTNKDTKFIWQMTWPYPSFNEFDLFKDNFSSNSELMYNKIVKNVEDYILYNRNFDMIVPSGTLVMNLKKYFDDRAIYRDVLHMSYHVGRYALSLLFAKLLLKIDINNVKCEPMSIPSKDKQNIIEAVNRTYIKPFEMRE